MPVVSERPVIGMSSTKSASDGIEYSVPVTPRIGP